MGKVAKAFGVGVKGALSVHVARDAFRAGDAIEGFVALRVTKAIDCQDLVLSVVGTESVVWAERRGDYSRRHSCANDFLHETMVLSTRDAYAPGTYSFRFSYRLQASLPSSFDLSNRRAKHMEQLGASVEYSLQAALAVTTSFSADLECSRPFTVVAQSFARPLQSVSARRSRVIRALGVVSRGRCGLSVRMDQDACVAGDMLLVQASVHNESTADVSSIVMTLYEHLRVSVGPALSDRKGCMAVCETKMSGVRAGAREDLVLSLPLAADADVPPIYPTSWSGTLIRWKFKLVVKCKFAMATGVEVEIPVVVLPSSSQGDRLDDGPALVVQAIDAEDTPAPALPVP